MGGSRRAEKVVIASGKLLQHTVSLVSGRTFMFIHLLSQSNNPEYGFNFLP